MNMAAFRNISYPAEKQKTYRCPCCHFKTPHGRAGYEICPVCFREDDGQNDHDVDEVRGGPNGLLSPTKAQNNFQQFGASDLESMDSVRKPLAEET